MPTVSRFCGGFLKDMVVDWSGRAYVGNFGFALERKSPPTLTVLVRVDLDGSSSVVADDLLFPNGAVVSADGRTLVVGEAFRSRYIGFTIATDGSLTDRRVWADLASAIDPPPLRPDVLSMPRATYPPASNRAGAPYIGSTSTV